MSLLRAISQVCLQVSHAVFDALFMFGLFFVGAVYTVDSYIMKYNRTSFALELSHRIKTNGATHLKPFTMNGLQYLITANQYAGSELFAYNTTTKTFSSIQVLPGSAFAFEYFEIAGDSYLFASRTSVNGNSEVLRWETASSTFSVFQSILTHSPGYSKFFNIGADSYLAVPNYIDGFSNNIYSLIYKWCGGRFVVV
jgi:hypothetical protein